MAGLEKFLQYLTRDDVSEMVFRTGAAAAVKRNGKLQAVTREALTAQHILKLMHETPLENLVPVRDGTSEPTPTRIDGRPYVASVARSGPALLLRVWLPASEAAEPEPAERDLVSVPPPAAPSVQVVSGPLGEAVAEDPEIPVGEVLDAAPKLGALLKDARARAASDLHIVAEEPPRFRCGSHLIVAGEPLAGDEVETLVTPLLDERSVAQLSELGYADFACQIRGAGRFRVNVNRQRTGLKACFRLVMHKPPSLEALGLPSELRQMLDHHQGLVVISGPSGAGKTTTLAALVDLFNSSRAVHIITVEDPVEIIHPIKRAIVSQREVGSHTNSFHAALKGSLREDPDVIAIGELRDRETVEKALEAAETGHLVFATMSTPSGATTIDRLIDMFPPDDQSQVRATLAGALKFVVSQRLVPTVSGNGLVAAVELLTGNMALWSLIRDDKLFQLPSLLQRGRAFGMIRVEDSLNALLSSGVIDEATAKATADDARMIGVAALGEQQAPTSSTDPDTNKNARRNPFARKDR